MGKLNVGFHEARGEDTPEQIQMCLSCAREKCVNCLDPRFIENRKRRMSSTKERVKDLWEQGKNDMQVSEELGLSHSHVTRLRNEMGLPAHRIRRSKGPYGPRKPKAVPAV